MNHPNPLNVRQQTLLDQMSDEWAGAPRGAKSATLLSLQNRGLVECRITPGSMSYLPMFATPYTGSGYQWRRMARR
jgi:hypothetical protein